MEDNVERCAQSVCAHLQDKMKRELVGRAFAMEAPEGYVLFEILGGPDQYKEHYDEADADLIHLYYEDGQWKSFSSPCEICLAVKERGRFPGPMPEGQSLNDVFEPYSAEIA